MRWSAEKGGLEFQSHYTCDVCYCMQPSRATWQSSSVVVGLLHRCVHCEAFRCEPLYILEQVWECRGDSVAWALSIMTFVQSPNSKGGVYCEFETLV